jgi:xylan 1,4-beta-xylosidase
VLLHSITQLTISVALALLAPYTALAQPQAEVVSIDVRATGRPFPHFWEQMFGSERAIVSLRESYKDDLRGVKQITNFRYVRFHGVLMDEVGVYDEDKKGQSVYNFSYIDQIYDGLLANGVRPFVELSFMPTKLAARQAIHFFWYHPNVSPPKDLNKWEDLIYQLGKHLVERYGEDEVAQWYFEVWNEPNIHFWAGEPKQSTYFDLYSRSARALKRVSSRLRVGGPATAEAAWVPEFIRWTVHSNVPLDFVSTHVYGNNDPAKMLGVEEKLTREEIVCRAVRIVHDQVTASPRPDLPIIWSEFNASYEDNPQVLDTTYIGPWLASVISQCEGLSTMLSFWTFSDVFEEGGVVKEPFHGGFGLYAVGHIPKPSFNAFALLHQLGTERLTVSSKSVLATRTDDGRVVIALWNLLPAEVSGPEKNIRLRFAGISKNSKVLIQRLDEDHGNVLTAYEQMGRPRYPTQAQLSALRNAAKLSPLEVRRLKTNELQLTLQPHSLVLLEIR